MCPHYALSSPQRLVGWGDIQGNSIETTLETDDSYSTMIITANVKQPAGVRVYRDKKGNIIKHETVSSNYDPRVRPWYLAATKAQQAKWTKTFLSYQYENLSIALALPIFNKQKDLLGVFDIELKLIGLSNYLSTVKSTPNSQILLIDGENNLIAFGGMINRTGYIPESSKIEELNKTAGPWAFRSLQEHEKNHQQYFAYKYDGHTYLAYYKNFPIAGSSGLKIGVVIPENDFTAKIKRARQMVMVASLFILIAGTLLTRYVSNLISSSLNLLVKDTQRIKEFHLDDQQNVRSHISEVAFLADAMESMKLGMRAFKKFVPTDLVRQLIHTGEGIKAGGVNKQITSFFTDIRGFTSISETMEPEQLMLHLCDYFEALSNIIAGEKGTIDKYIGDSIMAFWGAPIEDKEHCFHACRAALRCKTRLKELNTMWEKQNKPQLITSIGIHTGNAIVGNIGSSTRLNYTAIGDMINLTSRLESESKKYGSIIIVSEDVVNAVKEQFVFRFIEKVEIRGKAGAYNIYELVEQTPLPKNDSGISGEGV